MPDFEFHDAGCVGIKGVGRLVVPFRRLLRRLLRPIFDRQVEILQQLFNEIGEQRTGFGAYGVELQRCRLDLTTLQAQIQQQHRESLANSQGAAGRLRAELQRLEQRQERLEALHWDHVAVSRRLAILEGHVEALLQKAELRESSRMHTESPANAA